MLPYHNGSNGQIWDLHQKTNGTNGKVVSQGFILALTKNTFSSLTPSKLGKTPFFRAFFCLSQPCETTIPDRPELRFTNYQRHYILL